EFEPRCFLHQRSLLVTRQPEPRVYAHSCFHGLHAKREARRKRWSSEYFTSSSGRQELAKQTPFSAVLNWSTPPNAGASTQSGWPSSTSHHCARYSPHR